MERNELSPVRGEVDGAQNEMDEVRDEMNEVDPEAPWQVHALEFPALEIHELGKVLSQDPRMPALIEAVCATASDHDGVQFAHKAQLPAHVDAGAVSAMASDQNGVGLFQCLRYHSLFSSVLPGLDSSAGGCKLRRQGITRRRELPGSRYTSFGR